MVMLTSKDDHREKKKNLFPFTCGFERDERQGRPAGGIRSNPPRLLVYGAVRSFACSMVWTEHYGIYYYRIDRSFAQINYMYTKAKKREWPSLVLSGPAGIFFLPSPYIFKWLWPSRPIHSCSLETLSTLWAKYTACYIYSLHLSPMYIYLWGPGRPWPFCAQREGGGGRRV
jgi:hypothetical protein